MMAQALLAEQQRERYCCAKCHAVLFHGDPRQADLEVKCRKCGYLNYTLDKFQRESKLSYKSVDQQEP